MLSATARVSWLSPCRGGSICLLSGQRRVSPDSTESGGLLRHNIRLTRDCNWNCAGFGKVGKRLPEGTHERRGGAAARCRGHRSSGDARRRHRRSRLAPERGCHEVTGVEMARLRSKRRGSGICPAQGHRRMARLANPHQRTGAVAGLCTSKVGKRLERRRGSGICPVKKREAPGDLPNSEYKIINR